VAIVTGGNTGIGFPTCVEMSKMGCHTILACRSLDRANASVTKIKELVKDGQVEAMELDLGSLKSVRAFADAFKARGLPLHFLINNAGMATNGARTLTVDGFECQMGVNHLGHFLLTTLLLDVLKSSGTPDAPARIIVVSSHLHKNAKLDLNNLQLEKKYDGMMGYNNSKLANVWFTKELQKKLEGTNVVAVSLHPGVVATELLRNMHGVFGAVGRFAARNFFITPEQGAMTTLFCATSPDIPKLGGQYFADCKQAASSAASNNAELAKQLWQMSEQLVGLAPAAAAATPAPAPAPASAPAQAEVKQEEVVATGPSAKEEATS